MRQFVRGKPNPVGLKNFDMITPKGVPLDFYLYEGKGSSVDSCLVKMPEKLDVGGRMVLKLTETLPIGVSVYTDRYFTSISLIDLLSSRQITLAGTIMASRIPKNTSFSNDIQLKKSGRGSHDGRCMLARISSKCQYRRLEEERHFGFKLSVAQYLISTKKPSERREGNSEQSECEEEETPLLEQRKVQPVSDRTVRTVGYIHLPVFTKQEQKTR
ncbi:hypothetical protein JTB14_034473 [Gonioctena quinquepunctata]|nr:hypothetical protein JTB14_034473 [Gonioctena quinquepunctata]